MRTLLVLTALLLPLASHAGPRSYNVQRLKACDEELTQITSVDPERLNRAHAAQCEDDPACIERRAEANREALRAVETVRPDLVREVEEAEKEGKLRKLVRVSDLTYRVCSCARTAGPAQFADCVITDD